MTSSRRSSARDRQFPRERERVGKCFLGFFGEVRCHDDALQVEARRIDALLPKRTITNGQHRARRTANHSLGRAAGERVLKSTQTVAGDHNEICALFGRCFADFARCVARANLGRLNQLRLQAALDWKLRKSLLCLVTQLGFTLGNVGIPPLRQRRWFDHVQNLNRGSESFRQGTSEGQAVFRRQ